MSFTLHKAGIASVLAPITGTGASKFAQGYTWDKRDAGDSALKYPYWTVAPSTNASVEQYDVVGAGGTNTQRVATRITLFDRFESDLHSSAQATEDAFLALVDLALTTLRKDANISLGQRDSGCIVNRVVSYRLSYDLTNAPPLRIAVIECVGDYQLPRT